MTNFAKYTNNKKMCSELSIPLYLSMTGCAVYDRNTFLRALKSNDDSIVTANNICCRTMTFTTQPDGSLHVKSRKVNPLLNNILNVTPRLCYTYCSTRSC